MLDLSKVPVLETPRLRLRRPEAGDFEAYAALCADPEVMRYIGEGVPLNRRRAWHAFSGMLGLPRLVSVIIAENRGSIRVAEKIGERFDREGAIDGTPVRIYAVENPSRDLTTRGSRAGNSRSAP